MSIEPNRRRILVVDDDPDSLEIITEALRWEGYQVQKVEGGTKALDVIHNWDPDLVLLDMNMPGLSGIETLQHLRQKKHYVSVMFISGSSDTESVIKGLDSGADDYMPKPFDPLELLARVRTQLRIKDLNDQLRQANEKLKELVDTDDLTGLFNMRSIYQRLESEIERCRRFDRPVCVVMMDMDHFKNVNDGHDHLFGSFVISEVGRIIKSTIRSIDIAARYGGDEFLIALTETNETGAAQFCERLRKQIEKTHFINGKDEIKKTISLGFAIIEPFDKVTDAKTLVRTADHALYEAKAAGRNCFRSIKIVPDSKLTKKPPFQRRIS
jgi:two-component system cell cycle response regulator